MLVCVRTLCDCLFAWITKFLGNVLTLAASTINVKATASVWHDHIAALIVRILLHCQLCTSPGLFASPGFNHAATLQRGLLFWKDLKFVAIGTANVQACALLPKWLW